MGGDYWNRVHYFVASEMGSWVSEMGSYVDAWMMGMKWRGVDLYIR